MLIEEDGTRRGNIHFPDENPRKILSECGFNTNPMTTFETDSIHIDVYARSGEEAKLGNTLGAFLVFTTLGLSTQIVSCSNIFLLMSHLKPSLEFIKLVVEVTKATSA